jgi:mannan endo-1,4-beta-mannosidase
MIETPQSGCLEKPIGTFRPEHVRWIDHIVTFARKENIKLTITPWDTFWMNNGWDVCPYNDKLGGPVVNKIDFITKPEVKEAQKKRLKFIIDRWGNLGDIFCWELINEGDIWWGASPEQLRDWVCEMASFVRDYEKKKWGKNHMLSFSTASPMPGGALGDAAYRLEGMDFSTTHLYIGVSRAPSEAIGPALTTNEGVRYALKNIKDRRPYMDSENGPIDRWIGDGKFDNEVFHNMSWSHLASGGAGSGLRWPYRNPHHLSEGMYQTLSYMSKFALQAPWQKIYSEGDGNLKVDVPESRIAMAYGSPKAAILWSASKTEAAEDTQLKLTWPDEPGKMSCKVFDTRTGAWQSFETAVTGKEVTIYMKNAPASAALILESEKP